MQQTLELPLQVILPDNLIVLEKEEYSNLKSCEQVGRWQTLEDVLNHVSMSRKWLADNVLNNPKYRKILDVKYGGFVNYLVAQGGKYLFLKSKTMDFLEENFADIMISSK